jgi:hypothetical protein
MNALTVDSIATHVAPPHPINVDRGYQPYNKPAAILDWLEKSKPTEDVRIPFSPSLKILFHTQLKNPCCIKIL